MNLQHPNKTPRRSGPLVVSFYLSVLDSSELFVDNSRTALAIAILRTKKKYGARAAMELFWADQNGKSNGS